MLPCPKTLDQSGSALKTLKLSRKSKGKGRGELNEQQSDSATAKIYDSEITFKKNAKEKPI